MLKKETPHSPSSQTGSSYLDTQFTSVDSFRDSGEYERSSPICDNEKSEISADVAAQKQDLPWLPPRQPEPEISKQLIFTGSDSVQNCVPADEKVQLEGFHDTKNSVSESSSQSLPEQSGQLPDYYAKLLSGEQDTFTSLVPSSIDDSTCALDTS